MPDLPSVEQPMPDNRSYAWPAVVRLATTGGYRTQRTLHRPPAIYPAEVAVRWYPHVTASTNPVLLGHCGHHPDRQTVDHHAREYSLGGNHRVNAAVASHHANIR